MEAISGVRQHGLLGNYPTLAGTWIGSNTVTKQSDNGKEKRISGGNEISRDTCQIPSKGLHFSLRRLAVLTQARVLIFHTMSYPITFSEVVVDFSIRPVWLESAEFIRLSIHPF
jgi:hypothetical protein